MDGQLVNGLVREKQLSKAEFISPSTLQYSYVLGVGKNIRGITYYIY